MNFLSPDQLAGSQAFVIKFAAIVLLLFYFVYSFVIVKQVNLMTQTLDVDLKKPLKFLSLLHFICSVFLLGYAIIM